jgi:elongation factor G
MNDPGKIRNIALVGHRGTGKTSLLEAMLYRSGVVTRLGSVQDGTTVADFDDDEKKRQLSLAGTLTHIERKGVLFNLLDTPGDSSFLADTISALGVVETTVMVVNAVNGVEVQTERLWARAEERGLARVLFCNMLDRERADFTTALEALQGAFGTSVVAVHLPIGSEHAFSGVVDLLRMKAFTWDGGKLVESDVPADLADAAAEGRDALTEAVVETDDVLMEKYLEGDEIGADQLAAAFAAAFRSGRIFPVAAGSATHLAGVDALLDLLDGAPSPKDSAPPAALAADESAVELECDADKPAVALVFKTFADPFSGHVNVFRVFQGTIKSDSNVVIPRDGHKERLGQLLKPQGKEQKQIEALVAGDIGAIAKLKDVVSGDSICAESTSVAFPAFEFPAPLMSFAVAAKSKGDEDKVINALRRLSEEDPMLQVHRDAQTGETIVSGMSQVHVEVAVDRMKRRFGVEVDLHPPHVPYRETVKGAAKAQGRHKKQTGGRGQFADTWVEVSANRGEGFEFVDKIVGGAIPRNFIPAVEKGIVEAMGEGFLAGYPLVDVKVTLYDGKYHPVDSSDMAFKIAGSIGFKAAVEKAQPVLLEPIMGVEITVPEENTGDIIGDLNSRRGRVLGTNPRGHYSVVSAEVPLAEMLSYAPDLTSMTGGRGDYHMEFLRYEEVPAHIAPKVIEEARKAKEEAK